MVGASFQDGPVSVRPLTVVPEAKALVESIRKKHAVAANIFPILRSVGVIRKFIMIGFGKKIKINSVVFYLNEWKTLTSWSRSFEGPATGRAVYRIEIGRLAMKKMIENALMNL